LGSDLKKLLVCSCGSVLFILWGYYTRRLLQPDGSVESLRVHRVRCKSCGRTHAVLPVFLSGHVRHVLEVVEACLKAMIDQGYSVARSWSWSAIEVPQDVSTLYRWIGRIGCHCTDVLFHLQAHLLFVQPDFDLNTLQASVLQRQGGIAACWFLAKAIIESDLALPEHTPLTFLNYFCWQKLGVALLDP
jgi:transposase-like protein